MSEVFRVLAVDADPAIVGLVADSLRREDDHFTVETATSTTDALAILDEREFDAVISDYYMPGMDGLAFLEQVRDERENEIPFIIFTGEGHEEVAIDALNLGADRYLRKGSDPASQFGVLADAVRTEIENYRANHELRAVNRELEAKTQQQQAHIEQLEATEQQLRQEIEERKAHEQEWARYKQLLDALFDFVPIHLFVKDKDGRHLWMSSDLIDNPEQWIGQTDVEVESGASKSFSEEAYLDDLRVLEQGKSILDKEEYNQVQGKYFLSSKVPWRDEDGNVIGLLGYSFDITERKTYEQELERQNERLKQFASMVSHDLRNPLSVARGRFELLQEELSVDTEHAATVERALARMDDLIDDILTMARGGQPIEQWEAVSLSSVASDCWEMIDSSAAELHLESDLSFRADSMRVQRLFENLFRNAIDHGGDDITVTVGALEGGAGFYVADDGVGIPNADRDSIFEPGYTTRTEGTGFGLAIVEEMVAVHGWEIQLTESATGGARFDIVDVDAVE